MKNAKLIVDWDDWEGRGGFAEFDPFFLRDFLDSFQTFSLKKADLVTAASTSLKEKAKEFGKKVYLVPNGADVQMFKPNSKGKKVKDVYGHPLIVFIGILYKSCDLDIVIRAVKHVRKNISAKLIVVGDGPRKNEFIKLVRKFGLKNDVVFVGHKRRELIPEFIGAADVVVLPMKNNLINKYRSPVKLGEYLASGKAVVASNVGIAKEVIKNYHNGILTSNEPENFGRAIVSALENEKLKRKMEKNARKTAEEVLDWKKIAANLEEIYQSSINI